MAATEQIRHTPRTRYCDLWGPLQELKGDHYWEYIVPTQTDVKEELYKD